MAIYHLCSNTPALVGGDLDSFLTMLSLDAGYGIKADPNPGFRKQIALLASLDLDLPAACAYVDHALHRQGVASLEEYVEAQRRVFERLVSEYSACGEDSHEQKELIKWRTKQSLTEYGWFLDRKARLLAEKIK